MRLFTALDLPAPAADAWEAAQAALRARATAGTWTRRGQAHLTLHFLGDRDEAALPALADALAPVFAARPPIRLALAGLDAFPGGIPWVGVTGDVAALADLVAAGWAALGEADPRPYRPHLTLGRRVVVEAGAVEAIAVPPVAWTAAEVVLYRSTPSAAGSTYARLAAFPLGN